MKNFRAVVVLIIFQFFNTANLEAQSIEWKQASTWSDIKNDAKLRNKLVFIDCYATWCVPCKKMDKEVYANDSVAALFNEHFISVKLQMDSTIRDNEEIKRMYDLAKSIATEYQVTALPTFLFFTPDGVLINRDFGFKDALVFTQIARSTFSSERLGYYSQLKQYNDGVRAYSDMKNLAVFVGNVLGDKKLSKQIAADYINHANHNELLNIPGIYFIRDVARDPSQAEKFAKEYIHDLDRISKDSIYNKSILQFISSYSHVVTSSDQLFQNLVNNSTKSDSIMNKEGWTKEILTRIIMKEELYDKLIKDGKAILYSDPEWNKLKSHIKAKYNFIDSDKLLLDFQIAYYRGIRQDWQKWAEYKKMRIDLYPPDRHNRVMLTIELNDGGAWDAFLNCNDTNVLAKTIPWIDLAIKIEREENAKEYPSAYMDTKANILYKMGKTSEAIKIEYEILKNLKLLAKKNGSDREDKIVKEYNEVLEDMKQGKPTYLSQGAKWTNDKNLK